MYRKLQINFDVFYLILLSKFIKTLVFLADFFYNRDMRDCIEMLVHGEMPDEESLLSLLLTEDEELIEALFAQARQVRETYYGKDIFIRGLVEFTNYCRNDCYYCGIRKSSKADRYRLDKDQVLECGHIGYELGFRTFVLQGGEDPWFNTERMECLIRALKAEYPDCAVTVSAGEHSDETYRRWKEAGADRYLLRHETADPEHYRHLHPSQMSWEHRIKCLNSLKRLGYQTGCGFMVGSPGQTPTHLVKELYFLREFRPQMVGIGPFIPHHDTPFANEKPGTLDMTLRLLALIRLILPDVLLPATTALSSINDRGRELGVLAGANVVMPNLSPGEVRKKYMLYDNKAFLGSEAAEGLSDLKRRMEGIGYHVVSNRGDWKGETKGCMM